MAIQLYRSRGPPKRVVPRQWALTGYMYRWMQKKSTHNFITNKANLDKHF